MTIAVPCRTDEPALAPTVRAALAGLVGPEDRGLAAVEVLVCVNGPGAAHAPVLGDLQRLAAEIGVPVATVDLDRRERGPRPPERRPVVVALLTERAGKALAWNQLRQRAASDVALFVDADVTFAASAPRELVAALAATPHAVLASGKTVCAARPTRFEAVMAAPYGIDFPNLSPQLYAARVPALPPGMPEELFDPEHWLELVVGRERIVRCPEATVCVRLPGTLADFFRQRIRIEMGKVQLARDYPGLAARGAVQPRGKAVLASLDAAGLLRLAVYLALRESAYLIAAWRYRRGRTAGVWRQAASTKRWERA